MTLSEYQDKARRTQNPELSKEERMLHALHGLSAECGEIHSLHQKVYQGHEFSRDKAVDELGDLLWFAGEYADALEISLGEVAQRNIDKLKARYPQGFDSERSLHRQTGEQT